MPPELGGLSSNLFSRTGILSLGMNQVTVQIADQDMPLFKQWAEEHGCEYSVDSETEDYEIPEWQKEEVLGILDESKPEDFVSLEEAKAYLFRRRK